MSKAGPLILVADDDADTLSAYEVLLHARGWRTRSVADGPSALAAALELQPDLVLLDLGLPRMDGADVLRRMRLDRRCARIPVVVLTGRALPEDVDAVRRHGADAVLVKPCEADDLFRTVQRLLKAPGEAAGGRGASDGGVKARPAKPQRRSRQSVEAATGETRDLESLLLWADFLGRRAEGLRLAAVALCARAAAIRGRCLRRGATRPGAAS